nr:hypothetical protein [Saprospiraceae bacterium]
ENGQLKFYPALLKKSEFLSAPKSVSFVDINREKRSIELKNGQLFFTYCQVPVIYEIADKSHIEITFSNNNVFNVNSLSLGKSESSAIFGRKDEIRSIKVFVDKNILK